MSSFFNVVIKNLLKGPSTIKYPFEDSPAPENLRGKIKHDPEACIACHMCEHVCAGGAIKIRESEDKQGVEFSVWHNSCAYCGLCEFYCPTGAIHLTNDYHTAHAQEDKYNFTENTLIKYHYCISCGSPMIPLMPEFEEMIYGKEEDTKNLSKMCEKCRRKAIWKDGAFKL